MDNRTRIEPGRIRLVDLIDEIASGKIKVPVFQRDFVWSFNQMMDLFDSILKGFPIGSLLLWNPESNYETKKEIGPHNITAVSTNRVYVLDGYQRISTLFGTLYRPNENEIDTESYKSFELYYDLKNKEFVKIRIKNPNAIYIPLYKVLDPYVLLDHCQRIKEQFADNELFANELIENAKILNKILYNYEISLSTIQGGDIKSSTEIFSRINSKGTDISEDYMLQALSYNENSGFLLGDCISEFISSLKSYNFDDLRRDIVLNCISNSTGTIYFDIKVENLVKYDLEEITFKSFIYIKSAIKFLYNNCNLISFSLLPYPSQLIFISEFFRINSTPTDSHLEKLKRWFWTTSYSNYFTINSLSQQRKAYYDFCKFAKDEKFDPLYRQNPEVKYSTLKFPDKLNLYSVRSKTLQLYIINHIYNGNTPFQNESIREMFISNKSNRMPANIILRLGSEYENNRNEEDTFGQFILSSDEGKLKRHFLEKKFANFNDEDVILNRELLIKKSEKEFVEELDIVYTDNV